MLKSKIPVSKLGSLAICLGVVILSMVVGTVAYTMPQLATHARLWLTQPKASIDANHDPIKAAWQRTRAAGSYQFDGDVTQVTLPSARITNVGRSSKATQMHIEGDTDVRQNALHMQLWTNGGAVAVSGESADSIGVKVEDGKAYMRQGTGEWRENKSFSIEGLAPNGDLLSFLSAVRDVQAHAPESKAGLTFTRYSFQIDGPAFAAFMRDQMETAMLAKGELVPGTHLDIPAYYSQMTGDGELWVHTEGDRAGLPLRQLINLNFPTQNDASVHAQIKVNFLEFGQPPTTGLGYSVQWLRDTLPSPLSIVLVVMTLTAVGVLLRFYAMRRFQRALTMIVITVIVSGPLFSGLQTGRIVDAQIARATTERSETQAAANSRALHAMDASITYAPQQNPLQVAELRAELAAQRTSAILSMGMAVPVAAPAAKSLAQAAATDPGTDSDADGLSDFAEQRIGTDAKFNDSDEDGLPDGIEARGFTVGGKTWYLNPLDMDSNKDGIGDALEYDNDANNIADDTDADGLPDVFDNDNDNDGVPDEKDTAPFTRSTATYSDAAPMKLTLNGLQFSKATFVDFQIRPQTASHLWFAFNVLDWPQDADGQVRDIDGKTFADVGGTGTNDGNGDMRLIPMLEIRMPDSGTNSPPQADLTPYNITVNNFDSNGFTKVAYVPLSVVTDEKTGERVGFNARMRYAPSGSWTIPHEVRMVWNVLALNDLPCDPQAPNAAAQRCQSDGYIHNAGQVLHSYPDNFTLTGLNVTEDNGAGVAIVYEDPAVDPNKKDDVTLMGLSHGLDNSFLNARDQDNNGVRDITLSEIQRRFDRTQNASVSGVQRWGLSNTLRVELTEYGLADQANAFTAMTETKRILNNVFGPSWQTDKTLKPLLLFAQEQRFRGLNLDGLRGGGNFVALNGSDVTFNLAPAGQTATPVITSASVQWTPYCASNASSPTWSPCEPDVYWTELETRHGTAITLAGDPNDPDHAAGRVMAMQMYVMSLIQGINRVVQSSNTPIRSSLYTLKSDSQLDTQLRLLSNLGATAVGAIASEVVMAKFVNKVSMLQHLGRTLKDIRDGVIGRYSAKVVENLKNITKEGSVERGVGTAVASATLIIGILTGAYFLADAMLSDDPAANKAAKITIRTLTIAVSSYFSTISPIMELNEWSKILQKAQAPRLRAGSSIKASSQKAGAVGALLSVGVTWGFFIYTMVQNKVSAFSPTFNKAFAEAMATTIYLLVTFVIASTVIGTILVAIIAAIDAILTAICELGVDELRTFPGLGGACFTLGTSAVKVLAYFIYNYDSMIDTARSDMVVTGNPEVSLIDQSKGYVAGNAVNINLPITTSIRHKDPDPEQGLLINAYLYLFSPDSLKSSSYKYELTGANSPVTLSDFRDRMPGAWTVSERETKYVATTMYKGYARTDPGSRINVPLTAGINTAAAFNLNMGYAVPAYECWLMPFPFIPFVPPIPVCYTRELAGGISTKFDNLKYDVYPATLDGFISLSTKGANGLGLSWDAGFEALNDADGDGLISTAKNGVDPNDATWDADGDGLSDTFELERRQAGVAYSPISCDTDLDGLTDKQEMDTGSDPAKADSDNDGLKDGDEVWHLVYTVNTANNVTTCTPTGTSSGGWDVTINAATPFVVRVSSNPLLADGDSDGVDDLAEKQLAQSTTASQRVDAENRPYHPNIINSPPVQVYTQIDDVDGVVGPNQSIAHTTTIVSNVPLSYAVLDIAASPALGAVPGPRNVPLVATAPQTSTVLSNFTVQNGAATQNVAITSSVRSRLQNTGTPGFVFSPIVAEPPLGSFVAPNAVRRMGLSPARPDRQDNYFISALTSDSSTNSGNGDVVNFNLPVGSNSAIENDGNNVFAKRSNTAPAIATNNNGDSLVVWEQRDRCNTITLSAMSVVAAGDDPNNGIEPLIALRSDTSTAGLYNVNGSPVVWDWTSGGGASDMKPGNVRAQPNFGFPISRTVCGNYNIHVYEADGDGNGGNIYEDVSSQVIDSMTGLGFFTLRFAGNGHDIAVDVTVQPKDEYVLAGALVGADGAIKKRLSFARPPVAATLYKTKSYGPSVASNGSGFLVAYEALAVNRGPVQQWVGETDGPTFLAAQAFDASGNATGNSAAFDYFQNSTGQRNIAMSTAWLGNTYRTVLKGLNRNTIDFVDFSTTAALSTSQFGPNNGAVGTDSQVNAPQIAYDPTSGRWLMAYVNSSGQAQFNVYPNVTSYAPSAQQTGSAGAVGVSAAFNPFSQGWLVAGLFDNGLYSVNPVKLNDLTAQTPTFQGWTIANNAQPTALACPLPVSQPVLDLAFEELPSATNYTDASGLGSNAVCGSGTQCPVNGVPGAVDASGIAAGTPASDFALQFNGNQYLRVPNTARLQWGANDSLTWLAWVKASVGSPIMRKGLGNTSDLALSITSDTGQLRMGFGNINNTVLTAGPDLRDNRWHQVAASLSRSTGIVTLFVDGSARGSRSVSGNFITTDDLFIGSNNANGFVGLMDGVQVYRSALAEDAVKALYERTQQNYCVATRPAANGSAINWAKLRISQPDVRGGKVTASGGLTFTIDGDAPRSALTSLKNNQFVDNSPISRDVDRILVIGGTASDLTSDVSKVEVSVNGGPWQAASGNESWTFPLVLNLRGFGSDAELIYRIRTRATDRVGNVETPSPEIIVRGDIEDPVLDAINPTTRVTRNAAGQWVARITGSGHDGLPSSGMKSILVQLFSYANPNNPNPDVAFGGQQRATVTSSSAVGGFNNFNWAIDYVLPSNVTDAPPSGNFLAVMRFEDNVGPKVTDGVSLGPQQSVLRLDAAGPNAAMTASDAVRGIYTSTITTTVNLAGLITDTVGGLDKLEVAFAPISQVLPYTDTVLQLRLDESAGSVYFQDTSGQFNDAFCPNTTQCITAGAGGRIGSGATFNSNQFVKVRNTPSLNFDSNTSFTWMAWVKTNTGSPIMRKGLGGANDLLMSITNDTGQLRMAFGNPNSAATLTAGPNLRDNQWHHVAATLSRNNGRATLYVDGVAQGNGTFTGNFVTPDDLFVGSGNFAGFNGSLDEVTIFRHALSAGDVQALYRAADRVWQPATLSRRGTDFQTATWTLPLPVIADGLYQIDLRGTDALGNGLVSSSAWRGIVDTRAPSARISGVATGQSYTDTAGVRRYEVLYTCTANDLQLDESKFNCPGSSTQEPVRGFNNDPAIKVVFPDLALLTTLSITKQVWEPTRTPSQTLSACDVYNHCATTTTSLTLNPVTAQVANVADMAAMADMASVSEVADADGNTQSTQQVETISANTKGVIVEPARGDVVRGNNGALLVTVAAESNQAIKDVTVLLDGAAAGTLSFSQAKNKTRVVQSVTITTSTQGLHTLSVQVSDWAGGTSAPSAPIRFTLLNSAPQIAVGTAKFTISDTYQLGSGVLRLRGTVDTGNLAAVQVRVGDGPFAEANFGEGQWSIALPVKDQDNRQLPITVVAIDRAGQRSTISNGITQDISTANPPQTSISSGPTGQSRNDASAYDANEFTKALALSEIANPSDAKALSEAMSAQSDIEAITNGGDYGSGGNPNTATFIFAGIRGERDVVGFTCALDEGDFVACVSPVTYSNLSKGSHTFKVRAVDAAGFVDPTPASFAWTVAATQPDVTLKTGPSNPSLSRSAAFGFMGDSSAKSFECSLDGRVYVACSSGVRFDGLSNGNHVFLVRAIDATGKRGNAARYAWRIVNAAPLAQGQVVTTSDETPVAIKLSANDDDGVNFRIANRPLHGSLQGTPPNVTYIPDSDFFGFDEFSFVANDGQIDSAPAKVKITVQRGLNRFAALGLYGVSIGQQAVITSGDIGAVGRSAEDMDDKDVSGKGGRDYALDAQGSNGNDYDFVEVYIAQQARLLNANNFALGDTVVIRQGASLFNVGFNYWLNQGTVQGEQRSPLDMRLMPNLPTVPSITPGSKDVLVGVRGSLVLDPGSYANVWVKAQGTLTLKPGVYHFKSVIVDAQGKLLMQGATDMRVQGRLLLGQQSVLGPAPEAASLRANQIRIYVATTNPTRHSAVPSSADLGTVETTSAGEVEASSIGENLVPNQADGEGGISGVVLGQNSRISANIIALTSAIWVGQQATVVGALIGKWVSVGQQATLRLMSAYENNRSAASIAASTVEINPDENHPLPNSIHLPLVAR